jgi:tetratricopeptide (TPR) repeat protein
VKRQELSARYLLAICGALVVVVPVVRTHATPHQDPVESVRALLDRYERGEYERVGKALSEVQDWEAARRELSRLAPTWVTAAGGDGDRNRLIVAAFALEGAHAALDLQWTSGRSLVEWACAFLRESPKGLPAERFWHLASISLADRARDVRLLLGGDVSETPIRPPGQVAPPNPTQPYGLKYFHHLEHVEKRFPAEPRALLARAFVVEPPLESVAPRDSAWLSDATLAAGAAESGRLRGEQKIRGDWTAAIHRYRPLLREPSLRAEVHLRIGNLLLRLHEFQPAISQFDLAEASGQEPFVLYLARFFRAEALESIGRPAEAVTHYRSALSLVPNAQSGAVRLSALLFVGGARSEATEVATAMLASRSQSSDPWRLYSYGDYRLWSHWIRQLRAALK